MHSQDFSGPIVPLGQVQFSKWADVPGLDRIDFTVPAFMAFEECSRYEISWNGTLIKQKSGWNDYYGFGTSPDNLLNDCHEFFAKLRGGPDVTIISTIRASLCIESKDKPFYNHAQRINSVPMNWKRPDNVEDPEPREFTVWQSGTPTDGAREFLDAVRSIVAQDAAPSRNGGRPALSLISRTKPVSNFGFMFQLAHPEPKGTQ